MGKTPKCNDNESNEIQINHSSADSEEKKFILLSTLFPFERHEDLSKTKKIITSLIDKDHHHVVKSRKFGNLLNRSLQIMQIIKFERRKANKRVIRDEARSIHSLAIELLEKLNNPNNPARTFIVTDGSRYYSKESERNEEALDTKINDNLMELIKRLKPELNKRISAGRPPSDYPAEYVDMLEKMSCMILGIDRIPKKFIISDDDSDVTTKSSRIFFQVGQTLDPSLTAAQVRTYLKRRQAKPLPQKSSSQ